MSLTLTLNLGAVSAEVSGENATTGVLNQSPSQTLENTTNQGLQQQLTVSTASSGSTSVGTVAQSSATTAATKKVTTATTSVNITLSQINDAATRVKAFFDTNQRLPSYVKISTVQVTMPQFLQLLAEGLVKVSSGSKTAVTLKEVSAPENPVEDLKAGNIAKTEYINLAKSVKSFIDSNGVAPNYVDTSLGEMRYESLVYMFSKVMSFYSTNKKLPNYVSVKAWPGSITYPDVWVSVSGLTYYKQPNSYSCGPSSLKMALSVYGLNLSESWLEKVAGTTSANGTSHSGLMNAVNSVNAKYGTHLSMEDVSLASIGWSGLQEYLYNNNPVILHVKSWLSSGGHYVVLVGLNLGQGLAKLADPSYGGYRTVTLTELAQRLQWIEDTGRSSEPILPLVNN